MKYVLISLCLAVLAMAMVTATVAGPSGVNGAINPSIAEDTPIVPPPAPFLEGIDWDDWLMLEGIDWDDWLLGLFGPQIIPFVPLPPAPPHGGIA